MGLFSKKKFNRIQEHETKERKHTIMIVDDEVSNLSTLTSMFTDKYKLLEARDGLEAYELLTRKIPPNTVSLIISDQRMPRLSGTELFCRLIPIMPKTIRIILTGYTDVSAILDSINKAQIYKFVVKPFDREDLLLTVARALEAYEMREQLEEQHRMLEEKIRERTAELETKNQEILRTQKQLILQEKMASTGILAAGIAHELKNPLNFVNNFAELSCELFREFRETLDPLSNTFQDNTWEYLKETLEDLSQNTELIKQHGAQANRIVQSMMNLARNDSGERQATDLNLLVEEFVKLATSGLVANGLSDSVAITRDFDEAMGLVLVMSQSLGRVILNMVTNSLEAMLCKQESLREGYTPEIKIITARHSDHVSLTFVDNGAGIQPEHLEKIYNPFFTTKSAGSGNIGLGLSVCYEIVVREHGGELSVESNLGEYTRFHIKLPLEDDNSEV